MKGTTFPFKPGFLSLILFVFVFCVRCIPFESKAKSIENKPIKSERLNAVVQQMEEDSLISLVAVGDIMLGTNFPYDWHLPPKSVKLLEPMWPYFRNQDLVFGNLEGTVLNSGGTLKKCQDSTKCYAFRQPEYLIDQLLEAKFNLLSIANNHIGDFGEAGRSNTVRVLKEKGFRFAGLERKPYDTITVKGVKIGFIAFSPNTECLPIEKLEEARRRVAELNELVDVVIVSFHGGAEGANYTHVTRETEIFYEEDRGNVYQFARTVIDAGADVVLGHGPHVPRAVDLYKGRFITYSMGNFCTYSRFSLKGPNGIAPVYQIKLKRNGELVETKVISIKQIGEGGPLLDTSNAAYALIKKLTKEDIPEAQLSFGTVGTANYIRPIKN
ncbi:MAG: CapA family protein [Bacteroidetes bacterium]|nr:CapA family protein [Bacteroidota bacterium]